MNEFTCKMLESALERMKARGQRPEPRRLLEQAQAECYAYRDAQIEDRAEVIADHVPAWKLVSLVDTVIEQMNLRGEWLCMEYPDDDDEDSWVDCAAMGLACLQWFAREDRGCAPQFDCTEAEIEVWLRERRSFQMSLFDQLGLEGAA